MKIFEKFALENMTIAKLDKKKRIQIELVSILTSLIIMASPIVIACNFLIFFDYIFLTSFLLCICLLSLLYLERVFCLIMYKLELKLPKGENFKANYLLFFFFYLILVLVIYLVVSIILGVIFVW